MKKSNGTKRSNDGKKAGVSAGRRRTQRGDLRIRAVRRSKPDVQRLAQALIEIAISQAEVVVDEPDDTYSRHDKHGAPPKSLLLGPERLLLGLVEDDPDHSFEHRFEGEFSSTIEWAESMLDDMGVSIDYFPGVPEGLWPYVQLDVEGWVRDMEINGEIQVVEGGRGVYVFGLL